jgi:hypothetical protein
LELESENLELESENLELESENLELESENLELGIYIDRVHDQTITNKSRYSLKSLSESDIALAVTRAIPHLEGEREREFGFQIPEKEVAPESLAPLLNELNSSRSPINSIVEIIIPAAQSIKYDSALGMRPPRQRPKYRYPEGPWLIVESGQINEDFIRDRAALWRTGDSVASKSFGTMAIEDVMGLVAAHYQRIENHAKLEIDWASYVAKNQRYVSNMQQRLNAGIEIPIEEQQKILQKAPALTAIPVEPVYGNAADREVLQLESVATASDDIWDAVEAATKQEQAQFVNPPEGAFDVAMYTRTVKPEDADFFRQRYEKATASRQPCAEPITNVEEAQKRINALVASKGMPIVSDEERQRIKEQEKQNRRLAHWNSLLQTGIPSVIADVERQSRAQGYEIVDGQIFEVEF